MKTLRKKTEMLSENDNVQIDLGNFFKIALIFIQYRIFIALNESFYNFTHEYICILFTNVRVCSCIYVEINI